MSSAEIFAQSAKWYGLDINQSVCGLSLYLDLLTSIC